MQTGCPTTQQCIYHHTPQDTPELQSYPEHYIPTSNTIISVQFIMWKMYVYLLHTTLQSPYYSSWVAICTVCIYNTMTSDSCTCVGWLMISIDWACSNCLCYATLLVNYYRVISVGVVNSRCHPSTFHPHQSQTELQMRHSLSPENDRASQHSVSLILISYCRRDCAWHNAKPCI